MSTAYSAPINYGESIPLQSVQTIGMVQTAMSQKYDANLAKVDEIVNQYSSLALARSEDKQYLGERLQTLLTAVDGAKGLNWTDGNTVRMLSQHISKAVDPYIVQQAGITRTIQNFQEEVSKKKAKGDGLYSDENYTYAMKKAGYDKYMAKGSDTIGALEYSDYYDPQKNLVEPLEKWAKEQGYTKTVTNTASGDFAYINEKSETLSREKIQQYVDMKISTDPKLQKQLSINAFSDYQGISDDDFKSKYVETIKKDSDELSKKLQDAEVELTKYPKDSDEYKARFSVISTAKVKQQEYKNIIADPNKNYNRDRVEQTYYNHNLKNTLADTYANKNILSQDVHYLPEYVVKSMTEASLKNKPGYTGSGVATEVETPNQKEIIQTEYIKENSDTVDKSWANLRSVAAKTVEGWDAKTEVQKRAYLQSLAGTAEKTIVGESIPAELSKAASQYKKDWDRYDNAVKAITGHFDTKVKSVFESLSSETAKGSVNFDNLAQTAPNTVKAIRAGKDLSSLSPRELAIVKAEIVLGLKQRNDEEADNVYFDTYLKDLKYKNPNTFNITTPKQKDEPYKYVATPGIFKGTREAIFNFGEDIVRGINNLDEANTAMYENAYKQDQNIGEIGRFDVENNSVFDAGIEGLKNTLKNKRGMTEETMKKSTQITYNKEIKEEADIVNQLNSLHKAHSPNKMLTGNITSVRIDQEKGLAYLKSDTEEQVQNPLSDKTFMNLKVNQEIPVPLNELPAEVISKFNLHKQSFTYDVNNKEPYNKEYRHNLPLDLGQKNIVINSIIEHKGLPDDVVTTLLRNPQELGFKSADDYRTEYAGKVDNSFLEDMIASEYDVKVRRQTGIAFFYDIIKNGKIVKTEEYIDATTRQPHTRIDETLFEMEVPKIIDNYIINTLERNGGR